MDYQKLGLLKQDPERAFAGYTTIATLRSNTVRLVDMSGEEVHRWNLPNLLGSMAYLLPGGRLLYSVQVPSDLPLTTARGGRIIEMSWDGEILWEYTDESQHHDIRRLDDGNTAYIGWRALPDEFSNRIPGGIPDTEADGKIYEDYFRIVSPEGETVWEWSTSSLTPEDYPISHGLDRGEFGHANTICPLDNGDFLINFRNLDMIAVLSQSENRLIWQKRDETWGRPHDPQPSTDPSRILFFANGAYDKPKPQRSAIIELDAKTGNEVWRWEADIPWTFYSHVMGGVSAQPNGNLLVTESVYGRIFEVHRETGEIVWDFISPDFTSQFPNARAPGNCIFRSFRYDADSAEIDGNLG